MGIFTVEKGYEEVKKGCQSRLEKSYELILIRIQLAITVMKTIFVYGFYNI